MRSKLAVFHFTNDIKLLTSVLYCYKEQGIFPELKEFSVLLGDCTSSSAFFIVIRLKADLATQGDCIRQKQRWHFFLICGATHL